jgi:hypothetical protein
MLILELVRRKGIVISTSSFLLLFSAALKYYKKQNAIITKLIVACTRLPYVTCCSADLSCMQSQLLPSRAMNFCVKSIPPVIKPTA